MKMNERLRQERLATLRERLADRDDVVVRKNMDQVRTQRILEDLDTMVESWSSDDSLLGSLRLIREAVTSHIATMRKEST